MSMISGQIDELRELAGDGSMEWVSGPFRASVLRDAADTIWELRDDLQRANAENAKLRELVASLTDRSIRMADKIDCLYAENEHMWLKDMAVMGKLQKENERLKAENAKLRELVKSMYYDLTNMTFPPDWVTDYAADMRELGIEVDG